MQTNNNDNGVKEVVYIEPRGKEKERETGKYKICIPDPFLNCDKISPVQQRKVAEFINDLSKDSNVIRITVFGSSVTDHCHAGSDVDLYVEVREDQKIINRCYDFPFDLWTNYTVDERMRAEIWGKGLKVYERDVPGQSDHKL